MCVLCVLFGECPYIVGHKTIRKCITLLLSQCICLYYHVMLKSLIPLDLEHLKYNLSEKR